MKKLLLVLFAIPMFICPILKGQSINVKEESAIKNLIEEKIKDSPCLLHNDNSYKEAAIDLNGLHVQTTQTKLDQVELMKQFLGNWKAEFGKNKDTVALLENKSLYNGFDFYYQLKTKDNVLFEERTFTGYDEKNNRLIKVFFSDSIPEFGILTLWFTTATRCEEIFLEDISNPDEAKLKWIFEFKSPNLFIWTYIKNNEVVYAHTYKRMK